MEDHPYAAQGPYLLAALLCEKVLEEKDGVKTAVRIIDRVTHPGGGPSPPDEMAPFDFEVVLLIRLKSGPVFRGSKKLEIRLVKPSQESPAPQTHSIYFEGEEDRGVDVIARMRLRLDMPGLYWFHISLEGIKITQVPLRVIYLPQPMRTGG